MKKAYLIFILICLIGCLYHVVKVTQVFLTFETKVDVSLDSESQIVVPKITFCKALSHSYKSNRRKTDKTSILSIFNNTYDSSDVLLPCNVKIDRNSTHEEATFTSCRHSKVKAEKIISHFDICYSIKHPQFSKDGIRRSGHLLNLLFYHHNGKKLSLHLTSDTNIPDVRSDNSLQSFGNLISQLN